MKIIRGEMNLLDFQLKKVADLKWQGGAKLLLRAAGEKRSLGSDRHCP